MTGIASPTLSVIIPTFNRAERVERLVRDFLRSDIEICVHDDGSSDDTLARLRSLASPRLKVTAASNQGRAGSLAVAAREATAEFVMIYDDDDDVMPDGVARILRHLQQPVPHGACGFIFHMADECGNIPQGLFRDDISNFLTIRIDEGITTDRKEVVRRELFLDNIYRMDGFSRRIPVGMIWARMALRWDVICVNEVVGVKRYLEGGYTSQIRTVKRTNPLPMLKINLYRCSGFVRGRYSSKKYFLRSLAAVAFYGLLSIYSIPRRRITTRRRVPAP